MLEKVRGWRASVSDMGLLVGTLYGLSRLLGGISGGRIKLLVYHLTAQPVGDKPSLPPRRGRTIEVREIGIEEALTLPVARPPAVLEARFLQGARCLVASTGGRFLGFLWFVVGPYEEDEVRCLFVPRPQQVASWDFDVFVEASARMGFAFSRLWDEANQLLSSLGIRWSISRISAFNPSSLASHRRLGLVRVATAGFLSVGTVQLTIATLWPYVHLALTPQARPVLEVRAP